MQNTIKSTRITIDCINIIRQKSQQKCSLNYSTAPRRVVVTGLGVVSPVGCNVQTAWTNILTGFCGITRLTDTAYDNLPCKIAAKILDLKLEEHLSKSELRSIAPATAYALIAGK